MLEASSSGAPPSVAPLRHPPDVAATISDTCTSGTARSLYEVPRMLRNGISDEECAKRHRMTGSNKRFIADNHRRAGQSGVEPPAAMAQNSPLLS